MRQCVRCFIYIFFLSSSIGASEAGTNDFQRVEGPENSAASGLYAGVARADISPPIGIPKENWGAQTHSEAVDIHYPFVANVLVFSDGSQEFCLIDHDAIGPDQGTDVRKRIEADTGIPYSHIFFSASHTHSGIGIVEKVPYTTTDGIEVFMRYRAQLVDKIVGAAKKAHKDLQPVHIGGGKGICKVNVNRRFRSSEGRLEGVGINPDGFVDHEVVVVRIDDAQGVPIAVLLNYQAHPIVLAWQNEFLSPDYPGFARKAVEAAIPTALGFFLQGGAGNQGPVENFTGDLEVAERLGTILGLEAASVALGIETVDRTPVFEGYTESGALLVMQPWRVKGPKSGELAFAKKMVTLTRNKKTPAEVTWLAKQVADAKKEIEESERTGDSWEISQAKSRHDRLRRRLGVWKIQAGETEIDEEVPSYYRQLLEEWISDEPLTMEIRALRVGEAAFFFMAGEPFAEIGAEIKRNSRSQSTIFCGYTHTDGNAGGYMPVESEYSRMGYEVFDTLYGPESASIIVEEGGNLLERVLD